MTAAEYINETPGADWIYVDEGTEYTPEQAARRFLDHPWGHQVKIMADLLEAQGIASACLILGHEGSHIFATTHTCPPDRYDEGYDAGYGEGYGEGLDSHD